MADAELKAPEDIDGTVHTFHILKDGESVANIKPEDLQNPTLKIQPFFLQMEQNGLLDQISEVLEKSGLSQGELSGLSDFFKDAPGFEAIWREVNAFADSRGAEVSGAETKFGAANGLTIGPAFAAAAPDDSIVAVIAEADATPTSPGMGNGRTA